MLEQSLQRKPSNVGPEKLQNEFLLALINKLAAAFRVELSEATQAVYLQVLQEAPIVDPHAECLAKCLRTSIDDVICSWEKPSLMPTPAFILGAIDNSGAECLYPPKRDPYDVAWPDEPANGSRFAPGEHEQILREAAEKAEIYVAERCRIRDERLARGRPT